MNGVPDKIEEQIVLSLRTSNLRRRMETVSGSEFLWYTGMKQPMRNIRPVPAEVKKLSNNEIDV